MEVDLKAPASVIVAWRTGRNAHGRVVKAGDEVTESLRGYANCSLGVISEGGGRDYDPDDEQEAECPYLITGHDELLDTALLGKIEEGSSLPLATDDELRRRQFALYALIVGNDPADRTMFIRRGNPVKIAKKGFYALLDRTLTKVEDPIFSFDDRFDVVIDSSGVFILSQKNFEGLFKESEAVLAKTAEWAEKLGGALPMSEGSQDHLAARLRGNSVIRRRVQGILKSDYLHQLSPDVLYSKMKQYHLNPDDLMLNGLLIINKETEQSVLQLLNEDLWSGDFSGNQYAATRKSRR